MVLRLFPRFNDSLLLIDYAYDEYQEGYKDAKDDGGDGRAEGDLAQGHRGRPRHFAIVVAKHIEGKDIGSDAQGWDGHEVARIL